MSWAYYKCFKSHSLNFFWLLVCIFCHTPGVERSQSQADADKKFADKSFGFLSLLWKVCGQMFFCQWQQQYQPCYDSIMTCLLAVSRQDLSWACLWKAFKQTGSGLSWLVLALATEESLLGTVRVRLEADQNFPVLAWLTREPGHSHWHVRVNSCRIWPGLTENNSI